MTKKHPDCKEPGLLMPVVDLNRCEAKGPCIEVCPYQVFELQVLPKEQRKTLSLTGKLKTWAHGGKKAMVIRPDACAACGLCVTACPEDAIQLRKRKD
jgi:NAD-dependent dihydropyrimidine dehydrogenase PreA subunit